ncbi:DUF2752 domain-containing protein [Nonomuraea soli]|uniref:DUF2752 domain-containing protein n=1 Tax=Nonomuraea soli TaxID=1032476 RepID=A0A7W0CEX7_9ACTN|nr:DUF2752 domain-containing protein [Nonomuraea soli]MBA2889772.1 hypothetical protein [Nonomuraea soli]
MTALQASRGRALLAPAGVAAATLAGVVFVGMVDPNEPGHYPVCPFYWVTGLYCPGCGTLRAVHGMATFDLGAAMSMNPLLVVMVPVLVLWWARWMTAAWSGRRLSLPRPAVIWSFIGVLVVYWVVRNLPFAAFLAP